jgi:hypothetical protein
MDTKRVEKKDGKVFEITQIQIVGEYWIASDYKLELFSHCRITPTGHLSVARLTPSEENLPIFTLRWDQKAKTIDVDIDKVDSSIEKKFKRSRGGCDGHHSKEGNINNHSVFIFNIKYFGKKIFEGNLTVPVGREFEGNITLRLALEGMSSYSSEGK